MASEGQFVIRESGKFGVLPNGKFAIYGEDGACSDCCDPCCGAGVACSVPDTEAEGPGPVVTFDIQQSQSHDIDDPIGGDIHDSLSMEASGSAELARTAYEECDSAEYQLTLYSDVVNLSAAGDYTKTVVANVKLNAPGLPGAYITITVAMAKPFGSVLFTYQVEIYLSTLAGRKPCVESVTSGIVVGSWPDCIPDDPMTGDMSVPVSVHVEHAGECPTALHVSWGKAKSCSQSVGAATESYSYATQGQASVSLPWIRCNDEDELSDTCVGACCHDEGCDQLTKLECDELSGTFHPGQECSEAVCADCQPAGRRILCGGQFGVAAWDGTEWTLLPSLGGGVVQTLCVHNGQLYAGGSFVGGVMRWVCDHWELAGDGLNSAVFRLKSIALPGLGQTLVAVGQFSGNVGSSTTIRRAGYLDPATQLWKEYGDGFNAVVWDVGAADGSEPMHADGGVFFAGAFTSSGSGASSVQYLALDNDGARGAFVSPVDDPAATPPDDWARAVFVSNLGGTTCFFGGRFDNVGGVARSRFTSVNYSGGDWIVASSTFLNITGEVYRVLLFNAFFAAGSLASGGTTPLMRHEGGLMDTWTNITGGLVGRGHDVRVFNDFGGGVKLWLAGDIAQVITGDKRYVTSGDPETGPMTLVGDGSIVNGVAHALVAYTFPAPVALGGGTGSRPAGRSGGCGSCRDASGLVGEPDL